MEHSMTEVIGWTENILNGISVPVALHEQITVPIQQALGNLGALREMAEAREEAPKGPKGAGETPADDGDEPGIREEEI